MGSGGYPDDRRNNMREPVFVLIEICTTRLRLWLLGDRQNNLFIEGGCIGGADWEARPMQVNYA